MNRSDLCLLNLTIESFIRRDSIWNLLKVDHPILNTTVFTSSFPANELAGNIIAALDMIEKDLEKIRGQNHE